MCASNDEIHAVHNKRKIQKQVLLTALSSLFLYRSTFYWAIPVEVCHYEICRSVYTCAPTCLDYGKHGISWDKSDLRDIHTSSMVHCLYGDHHTKRSLSNYQPNETLYWTEASTVHKKVATPSYNRPINLALQLIFLVYVLPIKWFFVALFSVQKWSKDHQMFFNSFPIEYLTEQRHSRV